MIKCAAALLISLVCTAAAAQESFPFSEVKLQNGFGTRAQSGQLYSLMGNGQILVLRSDDEAAIVSAWRSKHPDALAVPVSSMGTGRMQMVYIWAIDGGANLNLTLIEKGVYPASVMIDAVQFVQLSTSAPDTSATAAMKAGMAYGQRLSKSPPAKEEPPQRFVENARYYSFLKQVIAAEKTARSQHNGIWSARYDGLREEGNIVPLDQVPPSRLGLR